MCAVTLACALPCCCCPPPLHFLCAGLAVERDADDAGAGGPAVRGKVHVYAAPSSHTLSPPVLEIQVLVLSPSLLAASALPMRIPTKAARILRGLSQSTGGVLGATSDGSTVPSSAVKWASELASNSAGQLFSPTCSKTLATASNASVAAGGASLAARVVASLEPIVLVADIFAQLSASNATAASAAKVRRAADCCDGSVSLSLSPSLPLSLSLSLSLSLPPSFSCCLASYRRRSCR